MLEKEQYCAIIADIKDSTKMKDEQRIAVQRNLVEFVEGCNYFYKESLAIPIHLSRGDAIQALFYSPCDAYNFVCELREDFSTVRFRVGMGYGDWSIKIDDSGNIHNQDGTSFQNAAVAFGNAHKNDKGIIFYSGEKIDAIINVLIENEDRIYKNQSDAQKSMAEKSLITFNIDARLGKDEFNIYTASYNDVSPTVMAEKTATTHQNVSQLIKRGKIREQRELKAAVAILMDMYFSKKDDEN